MSEQLGGAARVLRDATGNPALRWLLGAYALFEVAEYAIWIALLLYGFGHGGATGSLVMSLVQLVPSALLAPLLGVLADRSASGRVLVGSYACSAVTIAALGVAIVTGLPPVSVFALAPLESLSLTVSRPAHAALMPSVVRSAEELTASNVMAGWADAGAIVAGPVLTGALVTLSGAGLAIGVSGALMALATLAALAGLRQAPLLQGDATTAAPGATWRAVRPKTQRGVRGAFAEVTAVALGSFAAVRRSPATIVLLGLDGFSFVIVGALEIVIVVLATHVLQLGLSGAGYLTASLGGGAMLAGAVTMTLVGRPHLARVLAFALVGAGTAIGALGLAPRVVVAFVMIGLAGLGASVFDVTTRTLLQRAARSDSIAGAFSILEALLSVGFAIGALFARCMIALAGARGALLGLAGLTLLVDAASWRRLRAIDEAANVPQVEVRLLRSISIFAALPAPKLESVARELERHRVSAGTAVITEGDVGDRYYTVAEGRLAVTRGDTEVATLARGDGFGEIALVYDVARTATVTALTDSTLYSLDRASFLGVLTGHARAREAAQGIVERRLFGRH